MAQQFVYELLQNEKKITPNFLQKYKFLFTIKIHKVWVVINLKLKNYLYNFNFIQLN